MTIFRYFKDKGLFLGVNFLIYVCIIFFAKIAEVNFSVLFLVGVIWFLPLISYILCEYYRNNTFYKKLEEVTKELEMKFLVTEIVKEPNFIEGKIIYDTIKESNRNMHERVNYYEKKQREYKEYIDMWVHEIKTPIAGIRLIVENDESRLKNTLNREISKIDKMIEQVLYYSKIDKANEDYKIKKTSLKDIVMKTVKNNSMEFIIKKIKINIDENIDVEVLSDKKWLEFIMNQILTNSLKYTEENGEIKISLEKFKNNFEVTIKDSGVGIPKKDLDKVFLKGYTGENGRIFGKSTGMGLYICKKLCKKLNMGIKVESEKGTMVKLTIPSGENTNIF